MHASDTPRIDLHAHTTHSDGSLEPEALVALAAQAGLAALAVTDHDTTSALPAAHAAGLLHGIEILDGCEITARVPSGIAHVLAYAFDECHGGLQRLLAQVREGRDERNRQMHEKLEALGVPVEEHEVRKYAVGSIVARPHFAQALVDCGHVDTTRQAFDRYLKDRGAAYVRAPAPPAHEIVAAVAAAGGVAVLAHPRTLRLATKSAYRSLLEELVEAGLVGLEVDHPSQDPQQRVMFGELAEELDLVASGGSDFHGAAKPDIHIGTGNGTIDVRYETWERLRERAEERT